MILRTMSLIPRRSVRLNVKKEFEPKYGAGGEIVDDGIERAEVVFEAQKGELMDYNDRSVKRRVVPKIVTWDSVQ